MLSGKPTQPLLLKLYYRIHINHNTTFQKECPVKTHLVCGVYNFWFKEETGTLKKHWEFSKKSGIILSIVDRKGMILLILYTGIINYQRLKSYYNILPESFGMIFLH